MKHINHISYPYPRPVKLESLGIGPRFYKLPQLIQCIAKFENQWVGAMLVKL